VISWARPLPAKQKPETGEVFGLALLHASPVTKLRFSSLPGQRRAGIRPIQRRSCMAKFYWLDHSLKKTGGHHFDYGLRGFESAAQAGLGIVLAAHREFKDRDSLPQQWRVCSLFRHHAYTK